MHEEVVTEKPAKIVRIAVASTVINREILWMLQVERRLLMTILIGFAVHVQPNGLSADTGIRPCSEIALSKAKLLSYSVPSRFCADSYSDFLPIPSSSFVGSSSPSFSG